MAYIDGNIVVVKMEVRVDEVVAVIVFELVLGAGGPGGVANGYGC